MITNDGFEESCRDYVKRKQIAVDHGQNATHVDLKPLPTYKDIKLPSIAYNLALSLDELYLAVAYGDELAVYEVAELYHSVWAILLFAVIVLVVFILSHVLGAIVVISRRPLLFTRIRRCRRKKSRGVRQ